MSNNQDFDLVLLTKRVGLGGKVIIPNINEALTMCQILF